MTYRLGVLWLPLLLVLMVASTGTAEEGAKRPPPSHAFLDMVGEVTSAGDIDLALSMRPTPERWKLLKYRYNTPQILFRDLLPHHSAMGTEFPSKVVFDERNLRIKSRMILRGYARNEGEGEWVVDLDLAEGQKVTSFQRAEQDGRAALTWTLHQEGEGTIFEITMAVALPKGAQNIRVSQATGVFRYKLLHPEGEGRPRLRSVLQIKPRILTGAYKVYAMPEVSPGHWLAKGSFKNTGPSVVRRFRVRCRVQGYSEWGLWAKFPEIVPGQTVVIPFHPVLAAKVAQLQDKTPINVVMEWRYEDKDGKEYEDTDGARASLMGGHEFYFTNYRLGEYTNNFYEIMTENADLLAAWVSREDPVVDEFAAMANHIAGGAPSVYTPEAASATLHAIYELWVRNKFVYVSPAGITDKSVSFDPRLVQNLKYPRDVIRDKAGTCIDLAILYASMASALGLDAYLALVPGHCFPVFLLPLKKGEKQRRWLPLEATGIMGGLGPRVHSWAEINQRGQAQLQRVFAGQIPGTLVSITELRAKGLAGPQLPSLPADVLKRWGIAEGSGPILTAGGSGGGQPQRPPPPRAQPSPLIGRWIGTQVFQTQQGNVPAKMEVAIQAGQGGGLVFKGASLIDVTVGRERIRLASEATGTVVVRGNVVEFRILRGQTKNLITGAVESDAPSTIPLTLRGSTISGTNRNGEGILVSVTLQKQ